MPRYGSVLIVGDFNIHICCLNTPLTNDFLNLIDSFNFVQSVKGPTPEHGHTLDLVLSSGLTLCDTEICNINFSDHMPVIFPFFMSVC